MNQFLKQQKSIVILVVCFICLPIILSANEKKLNILVFHSYHESLPWTKEMLNGINKIKNDSKINIEFYLETIDFVRLKNQMTSKEWEKYLEKKYKGINFDGIISESFYATEIFENFTDNFYPNTPKLLYQTKNKITNNLIKTYKESNPILVKKTIEFAKKQNKKLQKIYIIKTKDAVAQELEKEILSEIKNTNLNYEFIKDFTIEDLKQKLSTLEKNSCVFYTINFQDNTGKKYIPRKFLNDISLKSSVPIYSFYSSFLGAGTIGGYMIDPRVVIEKLIDQIIYFSKHGVFIDKLDFSVGYIDYTIAEKYNLKSDFNNMILVNKPKNIYEEYPEETFYFFLISTLLVISILLLLLLRSRDKKILEMKDLLFLQSRHKIMGEMLNVIAHQWRQPINNISILTNTLFLKYNKQTLNDETMFTFKTKILNHLQHLSSTIDDFLFFHKPKQNKKRFNIKKEVLKSIEFMEEPLNKQNIQVDLKQLNEDIFINGYENEFRQCFLILLQNTIEAYGENNKVKNNKQIKIYSEINQEFYIINFEDNAGGIQKESIDKIFDPYYSTKEDKNGTGLGLYILKTIIEKYTNGSIQVENIQSGVKFELKLNRKES